MTKLLDKDGNQQDLDLTFTDLGDYAAASDLHVPVIRASDDWEASLPTLLQADIIAVDFAVMQDGRGFTTSRLLKERHGFTGKIIAVGDVLVDQVYNMKRCGFDLFKLRDDQVLSSAITALNSFTQTYQGANDDPRPHYRRQA